MIEFVKKSITWSSVGVFLAVIIGIPSLYIAFHDKKPNIVFQVVSESNVLDIHKPMKDLSITFRGKNLEEEKKNLKILTIKVENNGDLGVLQNFYDDTEQWGVKFENSEIVEKPSILSSSSDYIKNKIIKSVENRNVLEFNKIIFDKGHEFTFEVQLIHDNKKEPQLIPLGKIANVDKQIVFRTPLTQEKQSIIREAINGNYLVQIVRFFIYVGALILLIILIGFLEYKLFYKGPDTIRYKVQRAIVKNFPDLSSNEYDNSIIHSFINAFNTNTTCMEKFFNIIDDEQAMKEIEKFFISKGDYTSPALKYKTFFYYNVHSSAKIYSIDENGKINMDIRGKENLRLVKDFVIDKFGKRVENTQTEL